MRIALFTDSYTPEINGVATSVHTLFQELTRLGHEVHVYAPKQKDSPKEKNVHRVTSIPLVFLKERRCCMFSPALIQRINRYRFDIVHTHSEFVMGMLGRVIAKLQHCPYVHTYHTIWEDYTYYVTRGLAESQARKLAQKFSRVWCNHCDHVIVPTGKTHDLLVQYGVRTPMTILPSGLDLTRFAPALHNADQRIARRAECGVSPDAHVILNIGRIAREKNLEAVIHALPQVFQADAKAVFVGIGSGPWIEVLQKLALELGIGQKVLFPGPKPWAIIDQYYQIGDVFVNASRSETQGLTYIEALASGLVVVAQEDPCIQGVIEDQKNGLVVPQSQGLAAALCYALSPSGRLLSQAAAQSVQRFSKEAFARSVQKLYLQTLYRITGLEKWRQP